jgi:glycosyltransferase involved in cell wall biosynthesis
MNLYIDCRMSTLPHILLTNSSDIYSGGEFYVLELSKELHSRGYHVWVACKQENRLLQKCTAAGVPTIPVDFPRQGKLVKFIGILRDIIRKHDIDIIHTNTNYDRTAGAFASLLEKRRHITNVHSFHSLRHNLTHWFRNTLATDRYLVDGVCVKDMLVKDDGISASKISVVYLGVDPQSMKKNETQRRGVREEFGYNANHVVFGNVARLVQFKGQRYLIEAFGMIAKEFPDARLLIVGDGELREVLEAQCRTLRVREKVIFAGFRDDLNAVYSACDIYVHSSIEGGGETFPFAVLQALAQELPVVVTRVGDVAEMVEEGVNGFVVPDHSADALADRLRKLLVDISLRQSMAAKGHEYLLTRFTTRHMVDVVDQVYKDVFSSQ